MVPILYNFWSYVSNVGLPMESSPSEAKRFRLMNQFIVLSFIITAFYSIFYWYLGYTTVFIVEAFFTTVYFILWLISKENHGRLARFLFVIIINIQIYITCLVFGEGAQLYIIFGPIVAIPVVLYGFRQKGMMVFFVAFTVLLVFDLFRIEFSSSLKIPLTAEVIRYIRISSNILAIVCELIIIYALMINSSAVEQELGETNVFLEDQYKSIFNNSSDALFLIDYESKLIIKSNNRAVQLFEMSNENDFNEYQIFEFYKEEFKNSIRDKSFAEDEVIYKTLSGTTFWGASAVRLIHVNNKKFLTVRITDVSENKKNEELIKASLKEKEVLLAEIHHRVKNNLAVISGLLSLQGSYVKDKKAKILFEESRNRIYSMSLIHEKLYQNENFASIELDVYINDLIKNIQGSYNIKDTNIQFKVNNHHQVLSIEHAVPCGLILNELITNAYKHAFVGRENGEIQIEFFKDKELFNMKVSDNGIGYDAKEKLENTKTLGLTLISALADQLDAQLTTTNKNGTSYLVSFKV